MTVIAGLSIKYFLAASFTESIVEALDLLPAPMHVVVSQAVKLVERYAVRIDIHVLQLESELRQGPRFGPIKLWLLEPVRGQPSNSVLQNLRDAFYFLGSG